MLCHHVSRANELFLFRIVFGLVLQSVRNDGLVRPIGPRYIFFLGLQLAGIAFIVGLIPRYFDAALLVSTAFLGALAFSLGIVSIL